MNLGNNYDFIEQINCPVCGAEGVTVLGSITKQTINPEMCQRCSPVWPRLPSRNAETLRWHFASTAQERQALIEENATLRPTRILKAESLHAFNLQAAKLVTVNPTESLIVVLANQEANDINSFPAISALLDHLADHSLSLQVIEPAAHYLPDLRPLADEAPDVLEY